MPRRREPVRTGQMTPCLAVSASYGPFGRLAIRPPATRRRGYPPSMSGRQPMPTRPMVQKTNGSAIASLVLSILGLFGIGSLLGIIFGHRARKEIRGVRRLRGW